ncbi:MULTISPECIES: MFS transporter [Pseudomonas]|uniref:MFS transporter n=1 Tax=Pseudomonas sp. Hg7Tf TaxID=3236988 RepID=A0AB39I8Q5_9PSED|nr:MULTISPECIES: MFS transporter [Pseudomonas]KJK08282.1 3-phenylpropionic acid transporter [Pseudomonas sp. 5]MDD1976221.1 MHS family MFS transporter [Pseudomonas putida]QYX49249.1 MHS family MFS transporter [Pseudomonas sp. S11A 273]
MAKHPEGLHATQQTKKATASGWVGSALEYYDFFIYAQAAALIFPQIFFPSSDPSVAIIASLATYGVGYLARPIGAFVLGHWGDTRGRKHVLLLCMLLMGLATFAVGLLPTYNQIGYWAPALLVVLRLIQGFAVAGEIAGASSMILEHAPPGRRGFFASFTLQGVQAGQVLAAAIFLPLAYFMPEEAFNSWGWRIPFLLSAAVLLAAFIIRREVEEPQAFTRKVSGQLRQRSPIRDAFTYSWRGMLVVLGVSLMNVIPVVTTVFGAAYAVQPAYGVGFDKSVYLWIPVVGNIVAVLVIPFVGNLSDRVGRRPLIIGSALGCGLMSFLYLYAISLHNLPLAFAASLLMWGMIYQGYNAIFPSFFPEQFQTHYRVSAMAIAQNIGYLFTALLPALFTAVAPPGSDNVPLLIGSITCLVTAISAVAAWSAPETYRTPLDQLGRVDAVALDKPAYDALRATSLNGNLHP